MAHEEQHQERVVLVTHAGFASALMRALLHPLAGPRVFFHHYNTAITRIDIAGTGDVAVRYANRVHHLAMEMLS